MSGIISTQLLRFWRAEIYEKKCYKERIYFAYLFNIFKSSTYIRQISYIPQIPVFKLNFETYLTQFNHHQLLIKLQHLKRSINNCVVQLAMRTKSLT